MLFDDLAKEIFRKQLRQVADYTGLQVVTYVALTNHFHVFVRVPQRAEISDAELLRRYRVLYPRLTRYQAAHFEVVRRQLEVNGPEAVSWRKRQLALMNNLPAFMKLLKQRFSIWFNKTHQRFGTLWAERYTSTLIEPGRAAETVAAYVDLNPVRAGIVADPKDYRFCGYAEAVGGSKVARQGLLSLGINRHRDWESTQASYRELLYATGSAPREHGMLISQDAFAEAMRLKGRLPIGAALRCRLRYLSAGAVLGSKEFVEVQLVRYRKRCGPCPRTAPRPLPKVFAELGDLATLRKVRIPGV